MKTNLSIIILFALTFLSLGKSESRPVRPAKEMSELISEANIICVAKITSYLEEASPYNPSVEQGKSDPGSIFFVRLMQVGIYKFKFVNSIKGPNLQEVEVKIPTLASRYYGESDLGIKEKGSVLLFLSRKADGIWIPTDLAVPYIPLPSRDDNFYEKFEESKRHADIDVVGQIMGSALPDKNFVRLPAFSSATSKKFD